MPPLSDIYAPSPPHIEHFNKRLTHSMPLHTIAQRIQHLAHQTVLHHSLRVLEVYSHAVDFVLDNFLVAALIMCGDGIVEIQCLGGDDGGLVVSFGLGVLGTSSLEGVRWVNDSIVRGVNWERNLQRGIGR